MMRKAAIGVLIGLAIQSCSVFILHGFHGKLTQANFEQKEENSRVSQVTNDIVYSSDAINRTNTVDDVEAPQNEQNSILLVPEKTSPQLVNASTEASTVNHVANMV